MIDLPYTQEAMDEDSWNFMETSMPSILDGIIKDIKKTNATPDQIFSFIVSKYGREAIADRARQAARHYYRLQSDE